MIAVHRYAGLEIAVVGLGKSGLSAARALREGGARVQVWDDQEAARAKAAAEGFTVTEPSEAAWMTLNRVVWSPGIPHNFPTPHPAAILAHKLGKLLVCDVDLLCKTQLDASYIAITGTNGKSTTTTLIAHILAADGLPCAAGGNLGTPALDLPALPFSGTYVLELSSYQLELVPTLAADVAVWLNISPDHIDRHGSVEGYVAAKKRIFVNPHRVQTAIIGIDDAPSRFVYNTLRTSGAHKVIPVSVTGDAPNGITVRADGTLVDATEGRPRVIGTLAGLPTLPGAHNWQNAACAYAAARARGIKAERIMAALATFPGLPHRQQQVAVIEDVAFINDSKATNADATARALACYDSILWIAGGVPKEGGIESLEPYFPRIRHAFLIGQAAAAFAKTLDGKVAYSLCGSLQEAVEMADEEAEVGDVVLLSPACASFDQFANFEARGNAFIEIVHELEEAESE
ncbi:MAG: UDP-N-acetylmuramoyl-L-alanine--D-glutamate ligase [Rhodospirillaceae bacterium]